MQGIRAHIESGSESCQSGLLRAIFDKLIGAALKSMHDGGGSMDGRIAGRCLWHVSLSLYGALQELVGETPLEYPTTWRTNKVAKSVGYSEVN